MHIINLTANERTITLVKGGYDLHITGGHTVDINPPFLIIIKKKQDNLRVKLIDITWKTRSYENNKKSVKYYSFFITEEGEYTVEIHNPASIIVKDSILGSHPLIQFSTLRLFRKNSAIIEPENIDIVITRNFKRIKE